MTQQRRRLGSTCLTDGVLVALLDGALQGAESRAVEGHLVRCPACRGRTEALRDRDRQVRAWLRRNDPPPPSHDAYRLAAERGFRIRPVRWAAAVFVVVLAGLLSGPVRAWVVDRMHAIAAGDWSMVEGSLESIPSSHEVSFLSAGGELELGFDSPSPRGVLLVEAAADSLVTLRVPDASVAIAVQRGRIQLGATTGTEGLYRLTVPRSVTRIWLRVPGADPTPLAWPDPHGRVLRVDLGQVEEARRTP